MNDLHSGSGSKEYFQRATAEQQKQKIMSGVMDDYGPQEEVFNVEKEKEEDDKAILLEQIDMLLENLEDEGIDVSRIPKVHIDSPFDAIEKVHKILRLKNDRNRYCTLAEESILAGAYFLEWIFDGEKDYFGKKPDMKGWSATVNVKLRRMRYDTSTFVSNVMKEYNLNHGTRILVELLPSIFFHFGLKRTQQQDRFIPDKEYNNALNNIRTTDEQTMDS